MPRQNFSTRDISRYEWGATGTIFPSSCYPVSFFAVARPRDLSFAAARFQSPLSFFLVLSLFFSSASVQHSVTATAQLHHSCSEALPRSAFEVDGYIFVTRPRTVQLESSSEAVQVNLPRVSAIAWIDVSAPIWAESRIIPPRDLDYPILYRRVFQSDYRFDGSTTCFACPLHGVNH